MNFLLHHHIAALELGSEASGIGAMLPDLWRMADRRARAGVLDGSGSAEGSGLLVEVLAGIEHHIAIDRWFHGSPELVDGERACAERLRSSGASAERLGLFAHIVWEMALDGALVRSSGLALLLERLRRGFGLTTSARSEALRSRGLLRLFTREGELAVFEQRMARLTHEIARGPWIESYQSGPGLAACLVGVRSRLGMPVMSEGDREKVAEALEPVVASAAGALEDLLASRGRAPKAESTEAGRLGLRDARHHRSD